VEAAAGRRLAEEMGFKSDLTEAFSFVYKVKFDNGFSEHEYDHVFFGSFDGEVKPNPVEVSDYGWVGLEWLKEDIGRNTNKYVYWLKFILDRVISNKKRIW